MAVEGASCEVEDGELVVLVGPSGSGKSTLLRMIAGQEMERRIRESAATPGIEVILGRRPRQLSGGQRQRGALG